MVMAGLERWRNSAMLLKDRNGRRDSNYNIDVSLGLLPRWTEVDVVLQIGVENLNENASTEAIY
jgi:hypothetical protein